MLGLILTIESVVGLIQRNLTTAKAIGQAIKDGHTAVVGRGNVLITAAEIQTAIAERIAEAGAIGDEAAARIDAREGDG